MCEIFMNNMSSLVSVIVPIYNVKDYLEECVSSILSQTYTNIEIILVDDGSTDGSEVICEKLAKIDKKIVVYHKANGGLSSARNFGLTKAKGEVISFIDSDDFISPNMIKTMLTRMDKYGVEIVCCDYCSNMKNNLSDQYPTEEVLSSSGAISYLFNDAGYKCYAWNKIYKKELFSGIKYPEGKLFEDILTTYCLFKKANRVLYIKQAMYFYRIRKNSITARSFSTQNHDLIDAIHAVISDVRETQCCKLSKITQGYLYYYLDYIKKAVRSNAVCANEIKILKQEIKYNLSFVMFENAISLRRRAELFVFGLFPQVYCKIIKHFFLN